MTSSSRTLKAYSVERFVHYDMNGRINWPERQAILLTDTILTALWRERNHLRRCCHICSTFEIPQLSSV